MRSANLSISEYYLVLIYIFHFCVTEGVMAGAKAAVVATIATAIPTVTNTPTYSIFFVFLILDIKL